MKTILFAMIFLTISSSTFAGDTVGNGASMSKNCVGTKAGSQAGGAVGAVTGGYMAALLLGTGCAIAIAGTAFTLGAGAPVAVPTCTAAGAAIGGTVIAGGAIMGGVTGAKTGEQVGKLADGAGCE